MQKKKKRVPVSDPNIRVVLVPYPAWIKSYSTRVLPVFVPNIKIPESVSEKTGIYTIRIRYPTGIPDPFSPLVGTNVGKISSHHQHLEQFKTV
jgi:hypothetical protein